MRPPEGERLDDALELLHSHTWDVYKPQIADVQLAELLVVLEPWFRVEFAPRRKPVTVPKEYRQGRAKPKPAGGVTSSRVPKRIRDAVLARDKFTCQRCGCRLRMDDYSLQHRDNRGMGGSKLLHTLANLVALCGSATTGCHGHVEANPSESFREGWSVPNGADPEDWPVHRFEARWGQPGKTWELSSPHERQAEMGAVA